MVYWWSNLDLVTLGMDVAIIIIMWSFELGEHKCLIISFPTSLCLLTKNVNDSTHPSSRPINISQ
jgi:hypothetical protein